MTIGGKEFRSKKLAKEEIMNIVNRLIGHEVLPESEHFAMLWSLWQRSSLYDDGGSHFFIGQKFDGVAIKTVTREGKIIDWSIRNAVSGKDLPRWSKFIAAMRWAVRPHITKFRDEQGGGCVRCGGFRSLEVDHFVIHFKDLVTEFLDSRAGEFPEQFAYSHYGFCFRPEDAKFEAQWAEFHNSRCRLRLLCSDCHRIVTETQRQSSE